MKKVLLGLFLALMVISLTVVPASAKKNEDCVRIKDGILTYSAGHYLEGEPLTLGYDIFGYNYQGHIFVGSYANVYLGRDGFPPYDGNDDAYLAENPDAENHWAWPYRDIQLVMKWNDAWLSNKDCNDDGALDRHYGYDSYIGSGAWETNHMFGTNEDSSNWNYFTKIVAVPDDAVLDGGIWFTSDGVEIGYEIWGQFATIFEVSNDPMTGDHGVIYNAPAPTGFGYYMP